MAACMVTGAAAGNGLAMAAMLLQQGHHVIGIDRAPLPEGAAAETITGDITDDRIMLSAFDAAVKHGPAVCLINNAGVTSPEFPQSDGAWQSTIDVNLSAPFRWSREFARRVTSGQITQGCIIFIGSLATERGFPKNPAYQASKAGVLGLTRAFAQDLGAYGIRVNCVSPGYIRTAMTEKSYSDAAMNRSRRRHTMLNRWGEPSDVAKAVAFLCSDQASYITGINLPVDGGWLARGLIEEGD